MSLTSQLNSNTESAALNPTTKMIESLCWRSESLPSPIRYIND
jgi:hypothetical protein